MRLRDGMTFEEAKKKIVAVWKKVKVKPSVDWSLIDDEEHEDVFDKIEQYWLGNDDKVLDFSVCWLFCYGNSGGIYEHFKPEIPLLWEKLFDIPYQSLIDFQTAMDNGIKIACPLDRYLHKRRDKYRTTPDKFTFIDNKIRDFILMSILYET